MTTAFPRVVRARIAGDRDSGMMFLPLERLLESEKGLAVVEYFMISHKENLGKT